MSTDDMIRQGNKIDELQDDVDGLRVTIQELVSVSEDINFLLDKFKDLRSEVRTHLILIKTINEMLKVISKRVGLDDESE
jgi:hypothetical protein